MIKATQLLPRLLHNFSKDSLVGISALVSMLLGHLAMVQQLGTMVGTEIVPQKLERIWDVLQENER